ncbi:hypothetical protein F4821DRAFT_257390 [Hypoxylon rubiginosum]|uniref:Uncharacterized protein n=1 Tax=Hypoxylon rubiginosum TaxID=110542 RepID=A0ACC0D8P7_9PEZI|nr:hypothetical protein F4821DRAFT_257390 [Hypoxylon rubiginosum]
MFAAIVQRIKGGWERFKQRVTPPIFTHAWLLFAVIIATALALSIVCWNGMAKEIRKHDEETDATTSSWKPADANFDEASDLLILPSSAISAVQTFGDVVMEATNVHQQLATYTYGSRLDVSTVWVTVTVDPHGQSTLTSDASTSTTSTMLSTTSTVSSTASTVSSTTPTVSSTTSTPTVSSSSISPSASATSLGVSSVVYTTTDTPTSDLKYCPHSERSNIWTPCATSPSVDTQAFTATTAGVSSDGSLLDNPFSVVFRVLSSVWRFVSWCLGVSRDCDCCQDCKALHIARDMIQVQSELLESQERGRRDLFTAVGELMDAVRAQPVPGGSTVSAIDDEPAREL